jgi:hypothetical protein
VDGIYNRVGRPIVCIRVGCAEFNPVEYQQRIKWDVEASGLALNLGGRKSRIVELHNITGEGIAKEGAPYSVSRVVNFTALRVGCLGMVSLRS